MIYLTHPGIVLLTFAFLISFKKSWKNILSVIAPILSLVVLLTSYFCKNSNLLFSLSHKHEFIISISLLLVLIANNIFIISNSKSNNTRDLQLSLIYIGAGISIILSNSLVFIFLAMELMMIAGSCIIFNGNNKDSSPTGMGYLKMHILSGSLFLIGILILASSGKSLLISELISNDFTIAKIFFLLGLLINIALPPFSYWLTTGYPSASPFGSVILSVCMTKVSALLISKIFLGTQLLIYLGVFMGMYGILYILLETNLRRMITFTIISEMGLILIAIGIADLKVAISLIVSGIFYTAILMMSASNFIISHNINHYFEISKIDKKNIMLIIYIIILLSVTSFPLTTGYLNKYSLTNSIIALKKDWLIHTVTLINSGLIFALCFKTINFIFFYKKSKVKNTKSKDNNLGLYFLTITSIVFSYFACALLDIPLVIDIKILKQLLIFLVLAILFFFSRKYFFFSKPIRLIEPDWIYKDLLHELLKNNLSAISNYISNKKATFAKIFNKIIKKLENNRKQLSYSEYLEFSILLIVLILILFLL